MRRHRIVGDGTTILAEPQVGLARFEEHLDAPALPVELDDFFLRKREVCRDEDEIILPLVAVPHEDQSHRHEGFSLFRRDSIDGQEVTRASAAFLVFLVDGLDVRDLPFAEVAHLLALLCHSGDVIAEVMDGFQRRRRAEPCVEEDVLRGDSCRLDLLQQIEDDGWRFHLRELALLSAVASCIDGCAGLIEPDTKFGRISSKAFTKYFSRVIEEHKAKEREKLQGEEGFDSDAFDYENRLKCETQHIDGSMNALEKDEHLDWLRAEPDENVCKILFNVRCLSEGVDVPALDAVLFLSPRKSMVDVVQTVGRVMRKAPGKRRGYVIIPIVTPSGVAPDLVLDNNKDFDTVWQVLRALRSIDSNFGTIVDGQLGKIDESKMEVICLTNNELRRRGAGKAAAGEKVKRKQIGTRNKKREQNKLDEQRMKEAQASFDFGRNEILENELKARIVKRVGNRREWEEWAEDVGEICQSYLISFRRL